MLALGFVLPGLLSAAQVQTVCEPAVKGYASTPRALTFGDKRGAAAVWLLQLLR
jgi:hypothetical protein